MTETQLAFPPQPYKFLDYYRESDAPIFFGRRHEVEILLADIIATRLVVLFARTGTGKSSLIHAGVRPRLHALDYRTVLVRAGKDPSSSIVAALRNANLLRAEWRRPLAETLTAVVKEQSRPIVVFIDQFEEFFLSSTRPDLRRAFLKQVAELYQTPRSGVHLVFALREDYLAELDVFRDEIPTIFQKESQLRLRPFTAEQARDAVEGPSRAFKPAFRYEEGLVDRIVADLPREGDLILPVTVQIVCDTLWQKRDSGSTISRRLYDGLGAATGILAARLVEDVGQLDAPSLLALEKLIPHLSTPDWTKQPRTLSELQALTGIDARTLETVVGKLEKLHLFRIDARESEQIAEWVSDYVSALSKDLLPTLTLLWVRKMWDESSSKLVPPDRLVAILNEPKITSGLRVEGWYYLLRSSAGSRDTLGVWFTRGRDAGHDLWSMLRRLLDDPSTPTDDVNRVLLYLGEFAAGPAVDLIADQVQHRDRARARTALRALAATRSKRALEFLRPALEDPELHGAALDALQSLGRKDALQLAEQARKKSRPLRERLFGSRRRTLTGFSTEQLIDVHAHVDARTFAVLIGPRIGMHRSEMAAALAEEFGYPLENRNDFDAVLEFLTVEFGAGWQKALSGVSWKAPDPGDDYMLLAALPAPAYITTDPTEELEIARVKMLRGEPRISVYDQMRIEYASTEEPLLIHARGRLQEPDSITPQIDYTVLGEYAAESLSMTNLAGELLIVAVGFHYEDRDPHVFRSGFAPWDRARDGGTWGRLKNVVTGKRESPIPVPMLIVTSPIEVGSREAEERARRYFDNLADRQRLFYFWGTLDEFVGEIQSRFKS